MTANKIQKEAATLSHDEFNILYYVKKNPTASQRELSEQFNISLGKVNSIISELTEKEYLLKDKNEKIISVTPEGMKALEPFKVKNAIIMAAGLASRCAPLSYEKPKGLFKVKGEILIERQIKQLQERGIKDIYVVVGYMKELFYYLHEKYGVTIVINNEYYQKNNLSSIYAAKHYFGNSFVCYSDNYIAINGFEPYVYQSYFAAQYSDRYTDEYVIETDKNGLITQYYIGGEHCWYQMGEMYFSQATADQFMALLEKEYDYPMIADMKVDDFYIRHLSQLNFYIKKNPADAVLEFDTVGEIEKFDDKFLQNTGENILTNICSAIKCKEDDIVNVKQITRGNTNTIFSFECNGRKYVYRHPGRGSEKIIDRQREYKAMQKAAELGLDPSLIACDPMKGWKLSAFIDNIDFDYENLNDEKRGVEIIRRLHTNPVKYKLGWELDMLHGASEMQALVPKSFYNAYEEFSSIRERISKLYYCAKLDGYEIEMCHNDCCDSNILLGRKGTYLIDWEYAGDNDPAVDIATFIIGTRHSLEDVKRILELYFMRPLTSHELRHFYAFIAISAYFYFSWGIYEESIGKDVGDLTLIWYDYASEYGKIAIDLYLNDDKDERREPGA